VMKKEEILVEQQSLKTYVTNSVLLLLLIVGKRQKQGPVRQISTTPYQLKLNYLLARSLSSGTLTSGLLSTGHDDLVPQ